MTADGVRNRMTPFAGLTSWEAARAAALGACQSHRRALEIAVEESLHRIVAADVHARVDVPGADRAAMDGYAVRAEDVRTPASLRVTGRLAAGQPIEGSVEPGTCIEIATGALLPPGADAVVPVEQTTRSDNAVAFASAASDGQHVSRRGEDLRADQPIVRTGARVTAPRLAACVAGGVERLRVLERPRIAIVPTGDEVVALGQPLEHGKVYDSNAAGLAALVAALGGDGVRFPPVADEPSALEAVLSRDDVDLTVTIGGTSVGRRDLVSDVVARLGTVHVHGVAVRPGKPLLVATVNARPVLGLPGFPTTCLMLGHALLDPMIRRIASDPAERAQRSASLAVDLQSPAGLAHLMPVAVQDGVATPTFRFSSAISSMSAADGWMEIDADVERVPAGVTVLVRLF